MNWKKNLRNLELEKRWDEAIAFMQKVIQESPDDRDAYIFIAYLLTNLLVEEEYDTSKQDDYISLIKRYFDESYEKFSEDPKYLYFMGRIAIIAEFFYGLSVEDCEKMIEKAREMEPDNIVYKELFYSKLRTSRKCDPDLVKYAKCVLRENSDFESYLRDMGAVGDYLLTIERSWCRGILHECNAE